MPVGPVPNPSQPATNAALPVQLAGAQPQPATATAPASEGDADALDGQSTLTAQDAEKLTRHLGRDGLQGSKLLAELRAVLGDERVSDRADVADFGEMDIDVLSCLGHNAQLDAARFVAAMTGDDVDTQGALLSVINGVVAGGNAEQARFASEHSLPEISMAQLRPVLTAIKSASAQGPSTPGQSVPLGLSLSVTSGAARAQGAGLSTSAGKNVAETWKRMSSSMNLENIDVAALVQWVLREAYLENTKTMAFMAAKVKYFNEVKREIREELRRARHKLAEIPFDKENPDPAVPGGFTGKAIETDYHGQDKPGVKSKGSYDTKKKLEAYIKELEDKLSSVGDDAQLANVDMQNSLQAQQQTMSMLSNISKTLHDTAMSIIRKIG